MYRSSLCAPNRSSTTSTGSSRPRPRKRMNERGSRTWYANCSSKEVVELAQHERLEDHDRVPRLAAGLRLPRLRRPAPDRLQPGPEIFPGHHRVQLHQRIRLRVQPRIALRDIEKPIWPITTSRSSPLHRLFYKDPPESRDFSRCPCVLFTVIWVFFTVTWVFFIFLHLLHAIVN